MGIFFYIIGRFYVQIFLSIKILQNGYFIREGNFGFYVNILQV